MSKNIFKNIREQIQPSRELINKTKKSISEQNVSKQKQFNAYIYSVITVCLLVVIISLLSLPKIFNNQNNMINRNIDSEKKGIYINKIRLSNSDSSDALGAIIYNGNIYTNFSLIDQEEININEIKGKYIGRTKYIENWSTQKDYEVLLSSNIGEVEVYEVNGYNKEFRIMVVFEEHRKVQFYEHLNDIYIDKGIDLFGKMKIKGNVREVTYQSYDDWNNNKDNCKILKITNNMNEFIDNLYNSKFINNIDENNPESLYDLNRTILYLTLNDGTLIQLILFEGGYVKYSGIPGYGIFKIDIEKFNNIFYTLK